jgi:hypothetical protein
MIQRDANENFTHAAEWIGLTDTAQRRVTECIEQEVRPQKLK